MSCIHYEKSWKELVWITFLFGCFPWSFTYLKSSEGCLSTGKTLKVKVNAFCLNNSAHIVDVFFVPISILQFTRALLKRLRFLKTSLQSDTVMKNCSSGTTEVHYFPNDSFYKALQEHGRVKLQVCPWLTQPSADQLSLCNCKLNYFIKALF